MRGDLSQIGCDLDELQRMVSGLVCYAFLYLVFSCRNYCSDAFADRQWPSYLGCSTSFLVNFVVSTFSTLISSLTVSGYAGWQVSFLRRQTGKLKKEFISAFLLSY